MEDATAQHHLLWRYPRPRRVACLTFRAQVRLPRWALLGGG